MINKVIIMGRLTGDPEVRYLESGDNVVTRLNIAVERNYKSGDEKKTDFINCVAWGKTGEFIGKYFNKGSMIAIVGAITTGSYTNKDGVKVYTTEVTVSEASFTGEKKKDNTGAPSYIDDEIPFK